MANIDLTNYYRSRNQKISAVDSNIVLNKKQTESEIYSDVALDLEFGNIQERSLNAKESNQDLKKVTNKEAVLTSLRNILNTTKFSRLLDPGLEFDLRSYLFERLNTTTAWFIGYEICTRISKYEPRVLINDVNIVIDFENNCYIIELTISIPSLNTTVALSSILDNEGLSF